jgi:hypothetical protein
MKNKMKFRWLILGIVLSILLLAIPVSADTINGNADVYPNYLCGPTLNPPLGSLYPDETFISTPKIETDEDNIVAGWNYFSGFSIFAYFECDEDGKCEFMSFDWVSTKPVGAVLVKGGTCYWVYEYFPGVTSGYGLKAPDNGKIHAVSHADFGFVAPEFPTLALPIGMMIGIVGLVYVVRKREN